MDTIFPNMAITTARIHGVRPFPAYRDHTRTEPMLFQCEVMFGSPSSNCGGNGICKIVATAQNDTAVFLRTSCSHSRAFFTTTDDGAGAVLLFRRDWLCSNLMRRHFRHGILEMPEPCPIPGGITTNLGLKINELPAGLHLIEEQGAFLRVRFQPALMI